MTEQLIADVTKTCLSCRTPKSAGEFNRNRRAKLGISDYCRDCTRIRSRNYYTANRDKLVAKSRQWRNDNPAYEKAYSRIRYEANRDNRNAQSRAYYAANREQFAEWKRAWLEANRELHAHHMRRRRARQKSVTVIDFTPEQLSARWRYYGNKCWVCSGPSDSADHVKPIAKGGAHMLCNLRPICRPCNSAKCDKWPYSPPSGVVSRMTVV